MARKRVLSPKSGDQQAPPVVGTTIYIESLAQAAVIPSKDGITAANDGIITVTPTPYVVTGVIPLEVKRPDKLMPERKKSANTRDTWYELPDGVVFPRVAIDALILLLPPDRVPKRGRIIAEGYLDCVTRGRRRFAVFYVWWHVLLRRALFVSVGSVSAGTIIPHIIELTHRH